MGCIVPSTRFLHRVPGTSRTRRPNCCKSRITAPSRVPEQQTRLNLKLRWFLLLDTLERAEHAGEPAGLHEAVFEPERALLAYRK